MILEAITSKSGYADLWSDLRSMRHALERVGRAQSHADVTPLDKARLKALSQFITKEIKDREPAENFSIEGLFSACTGDTTYTLPIDCRKTLHELASYKKWLQSRKVAHKEKDLRLAATPVEYVETIREKLLEQPPCEEFAILKEWLSELLEWTESELST